MIVTHLKAQHVRCLQPLDIQPAPGINLVFGENASGKTSFLECLYLLSRGRSFRSNHLARVASRGQPGFSLFSRISRGSDAQAAGLGIAYQDNHLKIKADGKLIKKRSELATYLPLIILHQESYRILTEGPDFRRRFMNWGLFHVEQSFLSLWRCYSRTLKQRNLSLQQGGDVEIWDATLKEAAIGIDALRSLFSLELTDAFHRYLEVLVPAIKDLNVKYYPGWERGREFYDVLRDSYSTDKKRGYTGCGPHRADLIFRRHGVALKENISRGQQKLVICALQFAQAEVYARRTGRSCLILVDDVTAELDRSHRDIFFELIDELNVQGFVTATEALASLPKRMIQKRFHVKHGDIQEVL